MRQPLPLVASAYVVLSAIEKDKRYVASELGVPFGDLYILGMPDSGSLDASESGQRYQKSRGQSYKMA